MDFVWQVPGPLTPVAAVSWDMPGYSVLCLGISLFPGAELEAASAVTALLTSCVSKTWFLVASLTASSAAPPILALLGIPTEFKMVSF